jgi:hypothetical protein
MLLLSLACLMPCGCTRRYWRHQADGVTYGILTEKTQIPEWSMPKMQIRPMDPRSRFGDPYSPDRPPLPPDDPVAHQTMHSVYGMRGYKHWHKFGDTMTVENPYWLEQYGLAPDVVERNAGRVAVLPQLDKFTLEQSIDMAYIHSRDYQLQLETVYLTALALTLERFNFDLQFFGTSNRPPSSDTTLTVTPDVSESIATTNRIGINRFLPTGGQYAVEFLNTTMWLFTSGEPQASTQSLLSFTFLQPLLAGGGRRFALESLTQQERNTLYAVRNFARFRQSFFANIVAGTGFSGQVFANVTATGAVGTNFTSSATGQTISNLSVGGGGGGGAGGVGAVGGYLGMIQELQQIRNVEDNIRRTEEQLRVLRARASQRPREITEPLEAMPAGLQLPPHIAQRLSYNADEKLLVWRGELNDTLSRELMELSDDPAFQQTLREIIARGTAETININIAQLETNLANQIISLYTNQRQLQDLYDNFKIGIGVPTDMVINVDDSLLRQFEFMDPKIIALQDAITKYISAFEEIDDEDPDLEALRNTARGLAELRDHVRTDGLQLVAADFKLAADNFAKRLTALPVESDRERVRRDAVRDRQLFLNILEGFKDTEVRLNEILTLLESDTLPLASRRHALRELSDLREDYLLGVQSLSVVQIDLRLELISLVPFKMSIEDVMGIALANRQDLMNARGQVMDARRKIEVAANQLEATVNLVANGDIRTKTNAMLNQNPFDFRGKLSTFQAGVSFTTPIQLVVARNNYRAAMIFYEQARRNYMLTEDQVKQSVRVAWRQLHFLDLNFEQARISMRMSALQYDQAVEQTAAPVAPAGQPPGLNLLNALGAILNAQNALINIWVNYEANRLAIYRDMGTMELDDDGFWTDEYYQSLRTNRAPAASPPAGLPPEALPPEAPPATSDAESQEPDPHALSAPRTARVSLQPKSARIRLAAAEEEAEPVRTVTRDGDRRPGRGGIGGNRSRSLERKTLEVAP